MAEAKRIVKLPADSGADADAGDEHSLLTEALAATSAPSRPKQDPPTASLSNWRAPLQTVVKTTIIGSVSSRPVSPGGRSAPIATAPTARAQIVPFQLLLLAACSFKLAPPMLVFAAPAGALSCRARLSVRAESGRHETTTATTRSHDH